MAVLRELAEAGFEVIDVYDGDNVATTTTAKEDRRLDAAKGEEDGRGWSLWKMLERHDIVVHLGGVNSIVVNPMDDIFDALSGGVAGIGPNDVVGIVVVDDENDEDDNGYSKREVTKKEEGLGGTTTSEEGRLMVDSYALESKMGSSGIAIDDGDDDDDYDVGELFVFKSSSRQATASYAKSLRCLQSRRRRRREAAPAPSSSSSLREGGTARDDVGQRLPMVSETGEVVGGSSKKGVEDCLIQADENGDGNPRRLDRCLYDAASGRDCSHFSTSWDVARVARFPGGRSAYAGGAVDAATSQRNDTEAEDREGETRVSSGTPCDGPWEYPSEERCSNGQAGNSVQEEGICTYLCKKWFGFLVVEESEIR